VDLNAKMYIHIIDSKEQRLKNLQRFLYKNRKIP